jgi:alkylation response protein AidB-like acyl-CoA dehydrogenase
LDLAFGPEYDAFRQEVTAFLAENWPPAGGGESKAAAVAFRRLATEKGYLYRGFPRKYGGSEQPADPLRARIIREEFGKAKAPREFNGPGVNLAAPTLLACGTEAQKELFLPRTLSGELNWCQGYSEPGAGSDLASLRTRAVLEGDHWVINGQKVWTSRGHQADYMFALVRTEPDAPKHEGISYLLIDMKQPGITVRPLKQITGESEFNEVFFDDVRTPAEWLVGKRGAGWQVSRTTLKHERDAVGGASSTGDLFNSLLKLMKGAERDGEPALRRADVRQELARIESYVLAQRYSSYRQASMEIAGQNPGLYTLVNKLNGSNLSARIANLAQDIIGEAGLAMPVAGRGRGDERWVNQILGSLGLAIAGGTSNIQRNIIAERGLGLPRDDSK